jgi:hypothetical protein
MNKLPLPLVLIGAPILTFLLAYLAFVITSLVSTQLAQGIYGSILTGSLVSVYTWLKNREIKLSFLSAKGANPVSEKLVMRWPVMLVYGTLIFFGTIQVFGGLEGFLAGFFVGNQQEILLTIATLNNFLIWPIFAFVLGGWIGRKCNKFGGIILPIIIIVAYIANISSTFMLPESVIKEILHQTREELLAGVLTSDFLLLFALPSILFQNLAGFLGFWRGYRTRASDRIADLMGVLPKNTQSTLVDLMYEEAQKVLANPG